MMLNYRFILVTDAGRNAAQCAVYTTFGDVMPTDTVGDLLRSAAA